ncbi:uncharacterized protein DS421_15g492240 [Arachis hypogaea]|nr:uncharacterized protein DS421_15g492240 [Arachis hypogaea]
MQSEGTATDDRGCSTHFDATVEFGKRRWHISTEEDMESKLKTFTKGLEFFKIEADLAESEVIGREWKKIFGEQFSLTIIRLRSQ